MKHSVHFTTVDMQTEFGNITIRVDGQHAPLSAGNFLKYVDAGLFDGTGFYRVVTPENDPENPVCISVVQGGLSEDSPPLLPPIAHETTKATGLKHLDGVVSMARRKPGSAAGAFFICLGDQPALDFGGQRHEDGLGFAAFGQVTEGMDVVRKIWGSAQATPYLEREIKIIRAARRK